MPQSQAELPPAISKHKRQNISTDGARVQPEDYSLDFLLRWTLHKWNGQKRAARLILKIIPLKTSAKRCSHTDYFGSSLPLTIGVRLLLFGLVQPNIISIKRRVFTARVLSRPQHGIWPMRWLQGPFLSPNHLIFCPLRWKRTPFEQQEREQELWVSVTGWNYTLMFYILFKRHVIKTLPQVTLTVKYNKKSHLEQYGILLLPQ